MKLMADHLIGRLRQCFQNVADPRNGSNKQYAFDDIAMGAFSAFFIQSPSFLEHQRVFEKAHGKNVCGALFGIAKLPTDTHIRMQLDRIECQDFYPGFDIALDVMKEYQALQPFEVFNGRCLVALDGSEFHNSYSIHCPQCSYRLRNCGETEYYHSVLCATMVGIGHRHTVALRPEFMSPQDGDKKQDCEPKAAYRWFEKNARRYASLRPIYLGDDLYAKQPMCERVIDAGADFVFRVKTDDHKTLFDYLAGIDWPNKVQIQKPPGRNKPNKEYRYLWTNHRLPIRGGNDALQVNYVELRICNVAADKPTQTFRFITSLEVNQSNVETIVACGRARWKIENEGFNLLKNNGYHMQHNFGHGCDGLSNTLMTLNLIAFAFHSVCDHLCEAWKTARSQYSRRRRFFLAIDLITEWQYFDSWHALLSPIGNPQLRPIADPKLRGPP
jgi:hypothetical protein